MHFASHGLSQPTLRRLARQELSRPIRPARQRDEAACARADALEHAVGLTVLPVLAVAYHATSGAYGFLPLDLMLLAAALLIARVRLASVAKQGPGSFRRFR